MAITNICGFGTVPVAGDFVVALPSAQGGTLTYSRQTGRNGGYSLRASNSIATSGSGYGGRLQFFGAGINVATEWSLGFAMNHRAVYTPVSETLGLRLITQAGDWIINFGTGATPSFASVAGGAAPWTVLDGSATAIGWHWWNWVFKTSPTVGICEVRRDGVLLARANGDTEASLGYLPTSLTLYTGNNNGGAQVDVADVIWKNDATTISDTAVVSLFPDATTAGAWVGSDGNSVDNHLLINENPTYDPANYVGASAVNAVDTYTVANLPNAASSVAAVQVMARAFKNDAGAKTLAPMINGVAGTAADPGGGSTIYQLATTNPSGGAAWDTASVNAMTAGIKVVS